jgi:hypothetical protein
MKTVKATSYNLIPGEVEIAGISRVAGNPRKLMVTFKPIIIEFDAPPSDTQIRDLMEAARGQTEQTPYLS